MSIATPTPRAAIALLGSAVLWAGCSAEPVPQLLLPEAVDVRWEQAYNGLHDGRGALIPVDIMVYDGDSGEPLEGIAVELSSSQDSTWVLPSESVLVVDGEEDPEALWDARQDRYFALDLDLGEEAIGVVRARTGTDGVARAHLFVDAFPSIDQDFRSVDVLVSTVSSGPRGEGVLLLTPR